jgi:hypothetical protein
MSSFDKNLVLSKITNFYLDSIDFNGMAAVNLCEELKLEWLDLHDGLKNLIEDDEIGILYNSSDSNSHIIRLGFEPKDSQISKLITNELVHTCIYPLFNHLQTVLDRSLYEGEPYKLCLALGEPQLTHKSFDLSILEFYRNDPRYMYKNSDIKGYICVQDEYFESDEMAESDQILLESFGFSYDSSGNRYVSVYLRYLVSLSPEHQQIWKAKEVVGDYKLHPDYFGSTIGGSFGGGVSIFLAFLKELYIINQVAKLMKRPPLFNQDFGEYADDRPSQFSFLVRPTLEEFNNFVLLLDKILSDNINKAFFQNEVSYETEIERKDGKIQVQNKGTLQILDDWVREFFFMEDWQAWNESIKTFRDVRKRRQQPAHTIKENIFDQKYFKDQRELMIRAFKALQILRLIMSKHPLVTTTDIKIPKWLVEGKIWTY